MIPTFTLARKGDSWELISAGKYEVCKNAYRELLEKNEHNYDELVMARIRSRKRFSRGAVKIAAPTAPPLQGLKEETAFIDDEGAGFYTGEDDAPSEQSAQQIKKRRTTKRRK